MKLRLVKLDDLATVIAEIAGPFGERRNRPRPMEVHVTGRNADIKFFAAAVISKVLECDVDPGKLSSGKFIHSRGEMKVAFVDEGGKAVSRARASKEEAALPEQFREAKGILIVAHARDQRLFIGVSGNVFSQQTKMDLRVAIRRKKRRPISQPRRVKISAGGLPSSMHGEFRASLKPIAQIIG